MKNDMYELPEDIFDFAYFYEYQKVVTDLKNMAEEEDWSYHNAPNGESMNTPSYPILQNYFNNTYTKIAREKKVAYSKNYDLVCFDTGLLTRAHREPIYALFRKNPNPNVTWYWKFEKFFRKGEYDSSQFDILPEMAFYWDDPSKIIYDPRKDIVVNVEHIIQDNKSRFPEPYCNMPDYNLQTYIRGCVEDAKQRLKRNYKIAVPQYFITAGTIQLLIPLCLSTPDKADLAIVIEDYGNMYRASTCLTLEMAINNARLLSKPDRDWLNP